MRSAPRSTMIRSAVAAAVLAGTLVATAAPSQASAEGFVPDGCQQGYFCIWTGAHFSGRRADFKIGWSDLTQPIGGVVLADLVKGYANRTDTTWCVYSEPGYVDLVDRVAPGDRREVAPTDGQDGKTGSLRPC